MAHFAVTLVLFGAGMVGVALCLDAATGSVSKYGQLSVKGNQLVDKNGKPVQLKGMSLFWSVWMPQFWNQASVDNIRKNCHSDVVRAAMAVDNGGYLSDPNTQLNLVYAVIDAAIKDDMYVVVDWHDSNAESHLAQAKQFFGTISKKYAGKPNIIYETYNEPLQVSWSNVVKPYHEAVIATIRTNDPNNVIVCGTPTWSQDVQQAAADPIKDFKNIMYTLHYYAGTHGASLRDPAKAAFNAGLPIFVTEYGTVNADGNGDVAAASSQDWWTWLNQANISYINWAISDKSEGASALTPGTTAAQVCAADHLTASGKFVVAANKA